MTTIEEYNIAFAKLVPFIEKKEFYIKTEEDYQFIKFIQENDCKVGKILLNITDGIDIGKNILFSFENTKPTFGRICSNFEEFIKGDLANICEAEIFQAPFYICDLNYCSVNTENETINKYFIFRTLILNLIENAKYYDKSNQALIFVGKKIIEIKLFNDSLADTLQEITQNQCKSMKNLSKFLQQNTCEKCQNNEEHSKEKRAVLTSSLIDYLEEVSITNLIAKIEKIDCEVEKSYALYLENFSYSKVIAKLDEQVEKFNTRVTDTTHKLWNYFLALPFFIGISQALYKNPNMEVFIFFIVYCFICNLVLQYQNDLLSYTEKDVNNYEEKLTSKEMQEKWKQHKEHILELISKQYRLFKILKIILVIFLIYVIWKIVSLTMGIDLKTLFVYLKGIFYTFNKTLV
ncbi:hypothetical protein [Helicobacter cetorum]|uniref:hypothetical protein n=1 Tax=Helicobacter cetorum TaxID=138563 RepID=UPI000CF01B95|nr:hypothetical protein [Helicobacter cetorum]